MVTESTITGLRTASPELEFTASPGDEIAVKFPDGHEARIFEAEPERWYVYFLDADFVIEGWSSTPVLVLRRACAAWLQAYGHVPAPVQGLDAEGAAIIGETVRLLDTVRFAKLVRQYLRQRTGRGWSVRKSTGTSSAYLYITAKSDRDMTPMECALLEVVTGAPTLPGHATVSPDDRVTVIRRILGA